MNRLLLIAVLIAGAAVAEEPAPPPEPDLQQNIGQMRARIERDAAVAANEARGATIGMFFGGAQSGFSSSIGQMRREMLDSFEYLQTNMPCMGAEVDVDGGGQAILICGDNAGTVDNTNIENTQPVTFEVATPQETGP